VKVATEVDPASKNEAAYTRPQYEVEAAEAADGPDTSVAADVAHDEVGEGAPDGEAPADAVAGDEEE